MEDLTFMTLIDNGLIQDFLSKLFVKVNVFDEVSILLFPNFRVYYSGMMYITW